MAPPSSRGAINHGFQLGFGMGIFAANIIYSGTQRRGEAWGSWIPFAVAIPPAFFLMLGALLIPETPISLIQRDKNFHDTVETLQKIRGTPDVLAELNDIMAAGSTPITFSQSLRTMIRRNYWPQLIMAAAIPFFQQVTGFSIVAIYTTSLVRNVGFRENSLLMSATLIGFTSSISTIVLMTVVDRIGRRVMFTVGGIQMLVSLVTVIGSAMAAPLGRSCSYLVLLLFCIYLMGFGWSWGPLGWLVPSEVFQLEIRSAAQSIAAAAWFLFALVIAETFPTTFCHLKVAMLFFFAICIVAMTVFVYLFLPETGGIPLARMDRVWREHWFWKKIVEVEAE
ncbi:hexose carrier protein HEX6-like [Phoenix dactylifera]|uniref:Hexose carrier protein HEX6-like n=1 Tax=Phoenix dactylifera TaxID=42345 RepID=A0A8B8ZDG4_PHODC|nr:hexose carrier protein HEX6-like [Phoenix dactylifera]